MVDHSYPPSKNSQDLSNTDGRIAVQYCDVAFLNGRIDPLSNIYSDEINGQSFFEVSAHWNIPR